MATSVYRSKARRKRTPRRRPWWLTRARWHSLHALLFDLDRMATLWADGDEAVKRELWRNVHASAERLRADLDCFD